MYTSELIEHIATHADLTRAEATRALNAATTSIKAALHKGVDVRITGFGTFSVSHRTARKGRDPRNGQPIRIKAVRIPKFRPHVALKQAAR